MSGSVRKLIARLLPLAAAAVASVAIGASTATPRAAEAVMQDPIFQPATLALAQPALPGSRSPADRSLDATLVAQLDPIDLLGSTASVEPLDPVLVAPVTAAVAHGEARRGFELPRPDRWAALAATLALAAFFFLRRIV